jgi:DNA-binding Lrp family transcriptional regulator
MSTYEKTAVHILAKKSLKEIAKERDMTAETIVAHLEKLVEFGPERRGMELSDIAYFKNEIPRPHFEKIEQALEKVAAAQEDERQPLLSPVKNLVGTQISFLEIRLARVLLGYIKRPVNPATPVIPAHAGIQDSSHI